MDYYSGCCRLSLCNKPRSFSLAGSGEREVADFYDYRGEAVVRQIHTRQLYSPISIGWLTSADTEPSCLRSLLEPLPFLSLQNATPYSRLLAASTDGLSSPVSIREHAVSLSARTFHDMQYYSEFPFWCFADTPARRSESQVPLFTRAVRPNKRINSVSQDLCRAYHASCRWLLCPGADGRKR